VIVALRPLEDLERLLCQLGGFGGAPLPRQKGGQIERDQVFVAGDSKSGLEQRTPRSRGICSHTDAGLALRLARSASLSLWLGLK